MNVLNKILLRILISLLFCGLFLSTAMAQTVQIGEVGQQTGVDHNWVTVTLSGTYTDPIIIAHSRNLNGTDVSQARINNVTTTSFDVKVKDFDFQQQTRSAQIVSYMVVERGSWVLSNGQKIEAGDVAMTCCDVDASTTFMSQFSSAPAILATPNTSRTQSVYFRVKDTSATSFNARFTDADAAGDPETLNWIAMETGGDTTYGIAELLTTTQGVDQTWTYGQTFAAAPHVFVTTRSYLDSTPMTNRARSVPTTTSAVFYQQADSADVYHLAAEDVSAAAIPAGTVMGSSPLIVTTTADSGGGSLREAIDYANANAAEDDISFDISGAGPHVISLASRLPDIDDNGVSIDGTTQSGTVCRDVWAGAGHTLQLEIDAAGTGVILRVNSDDVVVRGLSLTGSSSQAVNTGLASSNHEYQCNYFGIRPDGTADGNDEGFRLNGYTHLIGGPGSTDGNIISGNTGEQIFFSSTNNANHIVEGNFIGPFPDGLTAPSQGTGILNHHANDTVYERNLISGNSGFGYASGPGTSPERNTFTNNYIGTTLTGNALLTNGSDPIHFNTDSASFTDQLTIGTPGNGNVIASASGRNAIIVTNSSNMKIQGNHIGVGADGVTNLSVGNNGIEFQGGTTGALIGGDGFLEFNLIGNTGGSGIKNSAEDVTILGNKIFNVSGTEEIEVTASGEITFPTVTAAVTEGATSLYTEISADVPAGSYRVEVFHVGTDTSGRGDAADYLGTFNITHGGTGAETFDASFVPAVSVANGDAVTATLTEATAGAAPYGATSELGNNATATTPLVVIKTNDSGAGSLRAAIDYANANTAEDDITFDLGGAGPYVISPSSALPTINDDGISIDGTTETGASCGQLTTGTPHNLMVQIDGTNAGTSGRAFNVNAADVTIRGLSITNFDLQAVNATANGDTILLDCLYVGIAPDGSTAGANARNNSFSNAIGFFGLDGGTIRNSLISGNNNDTADNGIQLSGGSNYTIEGTIIGLDETGTLDRGNRDAGILIDSATTGVTIGGTTAATRNIISGNNGDGIRLDGVSSIDILGNYIGLNAAGTASVPNGVRGIYATNVSTLNIGNGLASGRNVIVEPGGRPIRINLGSSTVSIDGNYLGTDITGNTSLQNGAGSAEDAIVIAAGTYTDFTITDNVIGGFGGDAVEMSVNGSITNITFQGNTIGVGADGITALPVAQDATVNGAITVRNGIIVNNMLIGGTGAGEGNIIANSGSSGIFITNSGVTVTGSVVGNTIRNNTLDGIAHQDDSSTLAIYGNSIHSNGDLGIDLSNDGVTDNDGGDADSGPNNLLNFPLINTISADGTTTVGYSVELDVPANTEGYRIEFFKNTSPDTTNGEGEIFLGFVDTGDHAGGAISYDGSFTSAVTVSSGDSISATTTRKTGATSYDITSEFAVNKTAQSSLVVTNINDSGAGSLRAAITYANANTAEDDITFNIAGSGVQTITLASALPKITDDGISIDGTTQSGSSCGQLTTGTPHTLNIEVDGGGSDFVIFNVRGDNNSIKGIAVGNSQNRGLFVNGTDQLTIECSYWGLRADGLTASPLATNELNGSSLINSSTNAQIINNAFSGNNGSSNDLGLGITAGVNGISMTGNLFGLGADGTTVVANTGMGLVLKGTNATVGGTTAATRNVFAGNGTNGIHLEGTSNSTLLGNYIGVDITGLTQATNGESGILVDTAASGITIGGTAAGEGNVISGNTGDGIGLDTVSDIDILGNYIGLNAAGTASVPNGARGIYANGVSTLNIGNGLASGRNVIVEPGDRPIRFIGGASTVSIDGNYLGTDITGNTSLQNGTDGGEDAIVIAEGTYTDITITDNVMGGFGGDAVEMSVSGSITNLTFQGNNIGVGADGTTALPIAQDATVNGAITVRNGITVTNMLIGGTGAGEGNIIANSGSSGIFITTSGATITGSVVGNTIYGNTLDGIAHQNDSSTLAIYGNSIHSNGDLGIDLSNDGVTDNDGGDADSGPNDLLNFPLINTISADGSTTVGYSVELDVPANTEGYRIEFFKNTSPDTTNGEGEIFLGFVDTGDHAGGAISYDGSFTSAVTVSSGDSISATTTRKTGATSYDITSEFAVNKTAQSSLVVTNINDSGAGSLRAAITYANANAAEDDITFDIDGAGPHTITLASALPIIADAGIVIDGSTQTGATCGTLVTGTQHDLRIVINGNDLSINGLAVSGASTTIKGLSIVNTRFAGLQFQAGADNSVAECNYMGMETDGSTVNSVARSNAPDGALDINGADSVTLHNNLISGTTGSSGDGIRIDEGALGTIVTGNIIGLDATGLLARPNSDVGIIIDAGSNGTIIGGTTTAARNIISGNTVNAIRLRQNQSDVSILGNYLGLGRDGVTVIGNDSSGISVINVSTNLKIGDGTAAGTNYIVGNGGQGVSITSSSTVSIPGNVIYNNVGIGIDLGGNGVSANDNGDVDNGPNELLNFPVINNFASDGNTGITYDINLDVPAADYRIDFYRNSAPHSTGYGEGEVHLGFVEFTHAGGNLQHTGAFTANATVIQGNHISATTTRKTGPSAYDITSEFSLTTTTGTPTELTAAKSVTVYDPTSAGLYSLPGNDVISSLTVTNPGTSPADADSIVIIDAIPAEVTFYNGDIDDGGPHSNAVSFVQTGGANLTFTYAADVKFSNSGTRPNDMAGCTYTPSAGYDTNVTFLCLNPKGAMAAGNPDPTFTVSYRAKIK